MYKKIYLIQVINLDLKFCLIYLKIIWKKNKNILLKNNFN